MLLTNLAQSSKLHLPFLAASAAISEALDYDRFFEALSSCFCCFVCDPRFRCVSPALSAKPWILYRLL